MGEGPGSGHQRRRLLVVAGDFNFNSTSAGYRRLVGEGGLESATAAAAATSVELTNGSGSGSRDRARARVLRGRGEGGARDGAEKREGRAGDFAALDEYAGDGDGGVEGGGGGGGGLWGGRGGVGLWGGGGGVGVGVDRVGGGDGDGVGGVDADGVDGGGDHDGDVDTDGHDDGDDDEDDGDGGGSEDDDPLDFVFFSAGPGAYFTAYEVHREFSQERYADGYPSVTDFDVSCPPPPS